MQLNASRIKVLQAQDDLVNSMKEAAAKELLHVSHNHAAYGNLLKDLIVQVKIQTGCCILMSVSECLNYSFLYRACYG